MERKTIRAMIGELEVEFETSDVKDGDVEVGPDGSITVIQNVDIVEKGATVIGLKMDSIG